MQTGGQCVFGHLKGCWCSLLTRLDLSENNIPIVTAACCVPHNICEVKGEKFQQGWGAEADGLAANFEQIPGQGEVPSKELCFSGRLWKREFH